MGLVNTAVGLSVIYGAMAAGASKEAANGLGYGVALLVSYGLNKRWTFGHRGDHLGAALRFALVVLTAYAVNLATLVLLVDGVGVNAYPAQAAAIVPYTLVTYLGSHRFAFRRGASRRR